jgi:arsenate reductase
MSITGQRSKSLKEYLGKKHFGYLISVCDQADRNCPTTFPGVGRRIHSSFEDPAAFDGTKQEQPRMFRRVRDQTDGGVRVWLEEV